MGERWIKLTERLPLETFHGRPSKNSLLVPEIVCIATLSGESERASSVATKRSISNKNRFIGPLCRIQTALVHCVWRKKNMIIASVNELVTSKTNRLTN